ncbi:hypothetical protein AB0N79_39875 [Streptomyces microflavus]
MTQLADDPPHVQDAARAAVDTPPGIGTIASFWTEVPLPEASACNAPGKGGAQGLPPLRRKDADRRRRAEEPA